MEENRPAVNRRSWVYVVFAAISLWASVAGFFLIFSFFPPYDDEGYLMMTVSQMLSGGVLYDEIYTQYGPAYYIYRWVLSGLLALPVTHDATRISTLVVWVLNALACGVLALRLSRSTLLAGASFVLTFCVLSRVVYEPGHPQNICGLLIVIGLLLLTGNEESTRTVRLGAVAIVVAALCLIKINLGLLFGTAIAITLIGSADFRGRHVLRIALTLAAAALPFILFRRYFEFGWLRFSTVVSVGVITAGFVGLRMRESTGEIRPRHIAIMAACFAVASVAIILITLAGGSSFSAVLDGVLFQHLKFGDDFYQPAPAQRFAAYWAFFALAIFIAYVWLSQSRPAMAAAASSFLKTGFGLAVVASSVAGYSYYLNHFILLNFATPFLWVLLIGERTDRNELARRCLVFTAVLVTMQIFPIAGTQMAYATFLMVVVGLVSLHDGLSSVKVPDGWFPGVRSLATAASAVALILFCGFWARENSVRYFAQTPLDLPGARYVRLPERDVELYTFLVANLNSKCDSFVTMPGWYSLNFWTGKPSPTSLTATAWMSLLNDQQQQAVVEKIRPVPRLCAVYHPQQTLNGSRNRDLASLPLASYILDEMRTESTLHDYQFMVRK